MSFKLYVCMMGAYMQYSQLRLIGRKAAQSIGSHVSIAAPNAAQFAARAFWAGRHARSPWESLVAGDQ